MMMILLFYLGVAFVFWRRRRTCARVVVPRREAAAVFADRPGARNFSRFLAANDPRAAAASPRTTRARAASPRRGSPGWLPAGAGKESLGVSIAARPAEAPSPLRRGKAIVADVPGAAGSISAAAAAAAGGLKKKTLRPRGLRPRSRRVDRLTCRRWSSRGGDGSRVCVRPRERPRPPGFSRGGFVSRPCGRRSTQNFAGGSIFVSRGTSGRWRGPKRRWARVVSDRRFKRFLSPSHGSNRVFRWPPRPLACTRRLASTRRAAWWAVVSEEKMTAGEKLVQADFTRQEHSTRADAELSRRSQAVVSAQIVRPRTPPRTRKGPPARRERRANESGCV